VAPGQSAPQRATSGLRGASAASPAAGMTVSVVGTDLSAPVTASNDFALQGVPRGPLALRFTGGGLDAALDLAPVESASENIEIAVSVAASSVILESERRSTGDELQLEGRVESLPPTTAAGTLVVAGQEVVTTAETRFLLRGSPAAFADLLVGVRVHVKGQPEGSSLLASVIDIQNTRAELPVNINGIIQNLSGPAAGFELTIEGRLVRGDADTEFFGGSAFADLANGKRAEVKGLQQDGFVYASRLHVNDEGEDEEDSEESASIEGVLESLTGSGDVLELLVGTTTVRTNASTVVQRRGDVQDLTVLAEGMRLHVVGDRQPDSSIDARRIQIKGDAPGSPFQIAGSMGGVKGTCAALQFGINGYAIVTDASTGFTPDCTATDFKSGTKVVVQGVVQADGSVIATSVEKQ
jgi:hypothetical protein